LLQELVREFGNNVSCSFEWHTVSKERIGIVIVFWLLKIHYLTHRVSIYLLLISVSAVASRSRPNCSSIPIYSLRSDHPTEAEGISRRTATKVEVERWSEWNPINNEEEHNGHIRSGWKVG
jgi:hypothetical protein